ncbi:drug/metabolite exporter YedA [Variovorax sp. PCZ-1]|uniref:drug/metabolite exporter YedA n=1 Tax=Variovorax sp. PCZ-1 TaxID=2835533 RepID=UPI001BCFD488|nr:drug/metabolite exporter YedA [Variovorax sp. PCZ-1]MBS7807066.1 drug/metabolite exporter YedA [Variovorax sp. PCZ-1]
MTSTTALLHKPSTALIAAALAAVYLVWGSTYLAIRFALVSFPPFFQMGSRFVVAGVLLMLFLKLRGEKVPEFQKESTPSSPQPWYWRNALIVGTLMLGGGMGLVGVASQTIGSGLIATFIAIVPMMVALIGLAFGKRPSKLEIIGMLIGFGGVILLVQGKSFGLSTVGLLAMFGATLSWSIGSVLQTTKLPLAPGPIGFASEMLCGGAVLLLFSLVLGEKISWPLDTRALLGWGYLIVFGSLIAFSAYLFLLANVSPALATSYAFVNPVIALFLGVWLGGEVVQKNEWLACAVILFGVLMFFAARLKTHSEDAPKK